MIKIANQQQIKQTNTKTIFQLIQTSGRISRAKLSKLTHLSPTTISTIVEELIQKGLVVESSLMDNPGAGRKAITLELNNAGKYVIGMEFNAKGISGTIFNLKAEPLITITHYSNRKKLAAEEELHHTILDLIRKLIDSVQDESKELLGICIGVPGLLDGDKKSILVSTPLDLTNVDIYNKLSESVPYPILIENETMLAAAYEKERFETTAGPFVYLSINNGLGACVMHHNEYLQGANGVGLEIGHMSLDVNGEQCPCGNNGCFELAVSTQALIHTVQAKLGEFPGSIIQELMGGDPNRLNESVLAEAVRLRDTLAMQVVGSMSKSLGQGIVNVINIFNPEIVVIGGRFSLLGEFMLNTVLEEVRRRMLQPFLQSCKIVLSRHTENAISRGGSILALTKGLEHQFNG
ncbi:ROK family transcriptional regulator [Paenibacillus cremeus]|uniref:ROK family transcriptional regulator n=1 Tax=Paenibacillus cremeus TaxID=2163881 RepID=A0A559K7A5_9BACL|nr:ROK family transcriptional regulator [Paenibacillus cremeus]TVY08009.1 ROK family transcriptional regulator [Paenibacillus cremeus]